MKQLINTYDRILVFSCLITHRKNYRIRKAMWTTKATSQSLLYLPYTRPKGQSMSTLMLYFFLPKLFVSRLSTCRRVCELSKIFMYAASVSCIVLSYSFLVVIFFARSSLISANLFVNRARSCWIFDFAASSFKISLLMVSRRSRKSSIHFTSSLL